MGKTRDGIVRDMYVTDPWQIYRGLLRQDGVQRFYVFAEIRDGLQ